MAKRIKIGDWVMVPGFDYEVRVTGVDRGTDELIVEYVLASGSFGHKTVSRKVAVLFVE